MPVSPAMNTGASVSAALRSVRLRACIAGLSPIMSSLPALLTRSTRPLPSRAIPCA